MKKEELAIDIKKYLVFEAKRYSNIMQKVENELAHAPEGSLHVARKGNLVHYYHRKETPKHTEVYISRKDNNLARNLAQKSYNKKILAYTKKVCTHLKKLIDIYEDGKIEEIYNSEHPDRKNLLVPVEITYEQAIEKWISVPYQGKTFDENTPIIFTNKGERVRSKSEKIMADLFASLGLVYKYESPVYLESYGTVYPDFTFLSPRTGKEVYWEHEGRMDDPGYSASAIKKIQGYEKNGIFPGESLILTYETKDMVLDTELVKALAKRYLMK